MSEQDALFEVEAPAEASEERRLDQSASEQAKKEGMAKAVRALRVQAWKIVADDWLTRMPVGTEWSNDKLYLEIGNPCTGANENNVVGAWVNAQARAGRIERTGQMVKSQRVSRHGNWIAVWRKLR
jgi:hypothetical protein